LNSINIARVVTFLNRINVYDSQNEIISLLSNNCLSLDLKKKYLNSYYEEFKALRNTYNECENEIKSHEWIRTETTNDKYDLYFNVNDKRYSWIEPDDYISSNKLITYKILYVSLFKQVLEVY
jgi:hypothetical protein